MDGHESAGGGTDHYFTAEPSSAPATASVRLVVDGRALHLATAAGVFSAHRIDAGTAVLLAHAPTPPARGVLADIGCGYGPIALALAIRAPEAHILAVDVNARARALTRQNADTAGLTNVTVKAPEDVADGIGLAAIYSNPPVRVGKVVLHDMLTTWLRRLAPDGRAYLVVHRHLGSDSLVRWLANEGFPVERLASVRGYRVLAVSSASVVA